MKINCVSHRIELCIKDVFKTISTFQDLIYLMTSIFYLMKRSGKFQRHFNSTAASLDVHKYRFPKVHGTRFVNHQRRGITILLHNWIPFLIAVENSLAHNDHAPLNIKLKGIMKKMKDFRFLNMACLFKDILYIISILSLIFEEDDMVIYDVMTQVHVAKDRLQELKDECKSSCALSWALMAKNSMCNSDGFSPYQLVFGWNPNLPSCLLALKAQNALGRKLHLFIVHIHHCY